MRIMIDLDVMTTGLWKGREKELALQFLGRVKTGEFEVYTPYVLLESVRTWKDKPLVSKILDFYNLYSIEIITVEKLARKTQEANIDFEVLSSELTKITKEVEDTDLVLISSIFGLDCLVTLNRKHLRNKKEQILQFLKEKNLKPIEVVCLMRFRPFLSQSSQIAKKSFMHTPLYFMRDSFSFVSHNAIFTFHLFKTLLRI